MERNRVEYEYFVLENFDLYLFLMYNNGIYGDYLILLVFSREYNLQIMVFLVVGLDYFFIVLNDGIFQSDMNILILGYFLEGNGEYYISVNVNRKIFKLLVGQFMCDILESMLLIKFIVLLYK